MVLKQGKTWTLAGYQQGERLDINRNIKGTRIKGHLQEHKQDTLASSCTRTGTSTGQSLFYVYINRDIVSEKGYSRYSKDINRENGMDINGHCQG